MSRTKFTCGCCGRELGLGEMVSTDGVLWRCKECSIKHNEEYCNKDAKIANLETKLAESESELVLARNTSINTNKMEILHLQIENEELKQQLAESEDKIKKAYREGLLQKQFDKDAEIMLLKQQLAEKEKEIERLKSESRK